MATATHALLTDDTGQDIVTALQNINGNGNLADVYNATETYEKDDLVIHNNGLYKANQDIDTAEAWTAAHWTSTTIAEVLAGKVNTDGNKVLTTNQVIITADDTTAPSDTTALWVYPAS